MAKISTYATDSNITTSDMLIGTDNENSNATKNFTVGGLIGLAQSIIIPNLSSNLYKGSFYDSLTQTLTGGANIGVPVILRNTDSNATNGVSVVTDGTNLTRITFANAGVYNIMFSAQLANSGGTSQTVDFWLRKNGSTAAANIADTNGKVLMQGNANFLMAAWNYFVKVNAGDYIQFMWTATSTNVTMVADAANSVHPATPSIILTANLV
jgi:plastocyanin